MANKILKLSVLLALTDSLAPYYKTMVSDYGKYFSGSQGAFLGLKKTYEANPDTIDEPSKRGNTLVQTTVNEKLDWFKGNASEYIDSLFAQEATNASGTVKAELVVEGVSWGEMSSLELLRLKSIVSSSQLEKLLSTIPVRSDSEQWDLSINDMYQNRDVWETPQMSTVNITTEKSDYILDDPAIKAGGPTRAPQVSQRTRIVELGKSTMQKFSGAWSQRQRAEALKRRATILVAITKALKECNDVPVKSSSITSDKIFGYLFGS